MWSKIGHTKMVAIGMQLVFNHSLRNMYSPQFILPIFVRSLAAGGPFFGAVVGFRRIFGGKIWRDERRIEIRN